MTPEVLAQFKEEMLMKLVQEEQAGGIHETLQLQFILADKKWLHVPKNLRKFALPEKCRPRPLTQYDISDILPITIYRIVFVNVLRETCEKALIL